LRWVKIRTKIVRNPDRSPFSAEKIKTARVSSTNKEPSWRFANLLATLLLLIAIHPFAAGFDWEPLALDVFLTLVVVAAALAVSRSTSLQILAFTFGLPVLGSRWLDHLFPAHELRMFGLATGAAFLGYVFVRVLAHVLRQATVTSETLYAALCVYLLFGLFWGLVFALLEQVSPGSFAFPAAEPSADRIRELVYYSVVTLTTVGYGDTTPVTSVAQGFSNLEAVLGQIYLAVLIARLVGLHIAAGEKREESD
jgi:voltage-gated potassium channel